MDSTIGLLGFPRMLRLPLTAPTASKWFVAISTPLLSQQRGLPLRMFVQVQSVSPLPMPLHSFSLGAASSQPSLRMALVFPDSSPLLQRQLVGLFGVLSSLDVLVGSILQRVFHLLSLARRVFCCSRLSQDGRQLLMVHLSRRRPPSLPPALPPLNSGSYWANVRFSD